MELLSFGNRYNRLYAHEGIEIWYARGLYLVIDRDTGYGKHYTSLEKARMDKNLQIYIGKRE